VYQSLYCYMMVRCSAVFSVAIKGLMVVLDIYWRRRGRSRCADVPDMGGTWWTLGPSSIISAQQINNGQAGMLLGRGSTSRVLREGQLRHDTSHSMSVLLVSRLGVFSGKFVQALRKSSDRRRKASSDLWNFYQQLLIKPPLAAARAA